MGTTRAMESFIILSSLLCCALSAPQYTPYINSGSASGPLTLAFGDAVQTPKGLRSLALEGFSEDLNQDGFVDPISQAVAVPQVPAVYSVAAPAVAPVASGVVPASTTAVVNSVPALTYAVAPVAAVAPVVQHIGYAVNHQVQKVANVHTVQRVINPPAVFSPFTAGFPLLV